MAPKRLLAGLTVAAFSLSSSIYASEQTDLLQVYQLALQNDAQLATAQASYMATAEALPQSRSALLPQIGVNAHTTDTHTRVQGVSGSDTSGRNSHGWSAQLTQPLFNLSSWFTMERAEAITEQARLGFSIEQQNLIMRVAEAYFNVLRAEDSLATTIAEETAVKRQLEQTRQRFEVGLIAETDVLEARAAYDGARVTRIQAKNQVAVSLENLRTLTNTVVSDLAKLDKTMPVATPEPMIAEEWVKTSVAQNLQLEASRKSIDVSHAQLKASRSDYAPTLDVKATYGHNVDYARAGTPGNPLGKGDTTAYSLELNVPIFTGGRTSSQVRESGYRLQESERTYDQTLRQVSSNTRNLFNTISADVERVDARCLAIVSSRSALDATESGYEVGTRNIVDVLNVQQVLYGAQRDYLNARYDFIVNTLKLKQMAGTLSPQDLQDLNAWMHGKATDELTPICKGK